MERTWYETALSNPDGIPPAKPRPKRAGGAAGSRRAAGHVSGGVRRASARGGMRRVQMLTGDFPPRRP
jgi:hypothetical protein